MHRRLALGVLALMALGLVTVGTAAAQDQGMGTSGSGMAGTGMGMGMSDSGMTGTSTPCMCMGTPGMSMSGMGLGGYGMGMGMFGMGPMGLTGMGGHGMGVGGYRTGLWSGPGTGIGYSYAPPLDHPGYVLGTVPCTGCGRLFDMCVFGGRCTYMEAGLWPEELGLHTTTNRADLAAYWPEGPMSCARGRGNNPAVCVDAPGEWNLRAGMPGAPGATGGSSR